MAVAARADTGMRQSQGSSPGLVWSTTWVAGPTCLMRFCCFPKCIIRELDWKPTSGHLHQILATLLWLNLPRCNTSSWILACWLNREVSTPPMSPAVRRWMHDFPTPPTANLQVTSWQEIGLLPPCFVVPSNVYALTNYLFWSLFKYVFRLYTHPWILMTVNQKHFSHWMFLKWYHSFFIFKILYSRDAQSLAN